MKTLHKKHSGRLGEDGDCLLLADSFIGKHWVITSEDLPTDPEKWLRRHMNRNLKIEIIETKNTFELSIVDITT